MGNYSSAEQAAPLGYRKGILHNASTRDMTSLIPCAYFFLWILGKKPLPQKDSPGLSKASKHLSLPRYCLLLHLILSYLKHSVIKFFFFSLHSSKHNRYLLKEGLSSMVAPGDSLHWAVKFSVPGCELLRVPLPPHISLFLSLTRRTSLKAAI